MKDFSLENPLITCLSKQPSEFSRADLVNAAQRLEIKRFTFHYTGLDGQLKELKLPISSIDRADRILAMGERVDGSSLFSGLVDSSLSDLYVVPVYKTAFINPFDKGSMDFVCRFLDSDGLPVSYAPDNILASAHRQFRELTGLELHAMGELEFFLLADFVGPEFFTPPQQKGYQTSAPFFKSSAVVNEMVEHISRITGSVKYSHAEVGCIESVRSDRPMLSARRAEQYEIEFLPSPIEDMGDFVVLARWIIRNVAYKYGMLATFTPKLEEGIAGNGLHVHMEVRKNGKNVVSSPDGSLSENAYKLIGGLVHYASSLSAFGNTVASAFLRLVPDQEAPTRICWSASNRSALIRIPLGWTKHSDLAKLINPPLDSPFKNDVGTQTVEFRAPDGSALFHLLLAGLTTAVSYGFTQEGMVALAEKTQVTGNIFSNKKLLDSLGALPKSCVGAANLLERQRSMYDEFGVFPPSVINYIIQLLRNEDDEFLNSNLSKMPADERLTATRQVMHRALHRH